MFSKLTNWLEATASRPRTPSVADPLDDVLFNLSPSDPFRIRDACESVAVFGAPGSAKTSGVLKTLAFSMLRKGFGFLVLSAKADEPLQWGQWVDRNRRGGDLVYFGDVDETGGDFPAINFLDYELKHGAAQGSTANLTSLLMTVAKVGERHAHNSGNKDYYDNLAKILLTNVLDVLRYSEASISMQNIYAVLHSLPSCRADMDNPLFRQESTACQLIDEAIKRAPESRKYDVQVAKEYLTRTWPAFDQEPRSIVLSVITTMTDAFQRFPLRQLFCEKTTISPEDILERGMVLVCSPAISVKTLDTGGKFAQVLLKTIIQRAVERQAAIRHAPEARPVCIFEDEAQFFLTDREKDFLQSSRSAKCVTVLASQSLPNYYSLLGQHEVHATLSCCGTKVFHSNGCTVTNEWASKSIAQASTFLASGSMNSARERSTNAGVSEQMQDACPTNIFLGLRKGGIPPYRPQAVVMVPGRTFAAAYNRRHPHWLIAEFDQNL